jgi:hypothetical protein
MKDPSGFRDPVPPPKAAAAASAADPADPPRKSALSLLLGGLTSAMLAWISLRISRGLVLYFARHPPEFSSAIATSIAGGLRTLLIGMAFLATFSFAFIGLGLLLVLVSRLVPAGSGDDA